MFNKIDMEKYERKVHYEYYKKIIKTKLNMSYNFDITSLIKTVNENNLRFYPVFIYIIMRAVNDVKEMRMAIDSEGNLGYYSFCSPSYTIFHNDDKTFSDIWTEYNEDFKTFYQEAVNDMEKYKNIKGVKAKAGRPDNFTPLSCVPWISFSSCSYNSFEESHMLFPVIVFGKYFSEGEKTYIPFTVYISHCVADGYHISLFINKIQEICQNFSDYAKI